MISPELWFTLYIIASKGAMYRNTTLTTSELGQFLGVSQQTASRRISDCVKGEYVVRNHTASGMILQLTEKGLKQLREVYNGLEIAFAPPKDDIIINGIVSGGIGEGAYYVDVYASRFKESLGFVPFSGTLNVRVKDDDSRKAVNKMKQSVPLIVQGFSEGGRTFGDVICYRVKVNDKYEAAVVIAQRTHHSQDILEIIAPVELRKVLKLKDNDPITLTLVPLHMIT
jgi:riboflavin kinase